MFREIREIRTREKITEKDQKKEEQGFRKIKPKNGMTLEEADKFWEMLFNNNGKENNL